MSKTWSLKRWLPLTQAAQLIATLTDDFDVSVADLLHLALEGRLKLSVVFPDGVLARGCTAVDEESLTYVDVPSLDGLRTVRICKGALVRLPDGGALKANETIGLLPNDEPFDLPLLGGELADVQRKFWSLTGSIMEETTNLDGTFVVDSRGSNYFQLLGRSKGSKGEDFDYPLGNLPENTAFVIRQSEIRRLVDSIPEPPSPTTALQAGRWPWGAHHTELLGHLEAAARRFWVNFDPADNTTAPTNESVSAWLVERGVSRRTADSMASILRADGLPTGPRTSH